MKGVLALRHMYDIKVYFQGMMHMSSILIFSR